MVHLRVTLLPSMVKTMESGLLYTSPYTVSEYSKVTLLAISPGISERPLKRYSNPGITTMPYPRFVLAKGPAPAMNIICMEVPPSTWSVGALWSDHKTNRRSGRSQRIALL